jgi:myosin heavy subunit
MLETIRIRKLGFPIRREFVAFRDRYRLLAPSSAWEKDDRKACSMILDVPCLHISFSFSFSFRLTDALVLRRSR